MTVAFEWPSASTAQVVVSIRPRADSGTVEFELCHVLFGRKHAQMEPLTCFELTLPTVILVLTVVSRRLHQLRSRLLAKEAERTSPA
jgi:hypothetical protein